MAVQETENHKSESITAKPVGGQNASGRTTNHKEWIRRIALTGKTSLKRGKSGRALREPGGKKVGKETETTGGQWWTSIKAEIGERKCKAKNNGDSASPVRQKLRIRSSKG